MKPIPRQTKRKPQQEKERKNETHSHHTKQLFSSRHDLFFLALYSGYVWHKLDTSAKGHIAMATHTHTHSTHFVRLYCWPKTFGLECMQLSTSCIYEFSHSLYVWLLRFCVVIFFFPPVVLVRHFS